MKILYVYREDIPVPIPFKKPRAFVVAYRREAERKTGIKHYIRTKRGVT